MSSVWQASKRHGYLSKEYLGGFPTLRDISLTLSTWLNFEFWLSWQCCPICIWCCKTFCTKGVWQMFDWALMQDLLAMIHRTKRKPSHPNKNKLYEKLKQYPVASTRDTQDPVTSLKSNMSTVSALFLPECTINLFRGFYAPNQQWKESMGLSGVGWSWTGWRQWCWKVVRRMLGWCCFFFKSWTSSASSRLSEVRCCGNRFSRNNMIDSVQQLSSNLAPSSERSPSLQRSFDVNCVCLLRIRPEAHWPPHRP